MAESNVIFRVDDALKSAFAEAAKGQDRTASQALRELMREYVQKQSEPSDYDTWLARKVEASRRSLTEHGAIAGDDVEAYFTERRTASRRKAAKAGS